MKKPFLLLVIFFMILSCRTDRDERQVKYEVSSSPGGFSGTYSVIGGNVISYSSTESSWTESFSVKAGTGVEISAQADNKNATITVKIYNGDEIISQETNTGDYASVHASGTVK